MFDIPWLGRIARKLATHLRTLPASPNAWSTLLYQSTRACPTAKTMGKVFSRYHRKNDSPRACWKRTCRSFALWFLLTPTDLVTLTLPTDLPHQKRELIPTTELPKLVFPHCRKLPEDLAAQTACGHKWYCQVWLLVFSKDSV